MEYFKLLEQIPILSFRLINPAILNVDSEATEVAGIELKRLFKFANRGISFE